jgi:multicomponent Na+:H+ antiporter subunit E
MPAARRGALLFGLWLVVSGSLAPADLAMGLMAAALGAWASLRLAPAGPGTAPRPLALATLLLRLPVQALLAGTDVALRALSPRPKLRAGLVAFAPRLPAGPRRDAFLALTSLLPGTLPAGPRGKGVAIHALDTAQPVAEDIAAEEARFARATGDG